MFARTNFSCFLCARVAKRLVNWQLSLLVTLSIWCSQRQHKSRKVAASSFCLLRRNKLEFARRLIDCSLAALLTEDCLLCFRRCNANFINCLLVCLLVVFVGRPTNALLTSSKFDALLALNARVLLLSPQTLAVIEARRSVQFSPTVFCDLCARICARKSLCSRRAVLRK